MTASKGDTVTVRSLQPNVSHQVRIPQQRLGSVVVICLPCEGALVQTRCDDTYAPLVNSDKSETRIWCFLSSRLSRGPAVYALRVESEGRPIKARFHLSLYLAVSESCPNAWANRPRHKSPKLSNLLSNCSQAFCLLHYFGIMPDLFGTAVRLISFI